ncbi:ras-like family member 11 [Anaeramoeba ignava]|uniref:small monomeric GTPase n=1 Tax=Anaeramoeba ignava TaxID=1746090 RepID=A0A9Q0LCC2_ANAIG|nr:ras-like family member 11 [Anaeramoeba ignava]
MSQQNNNNNSNQLRVYKIGVLGEGYTGKSTFIIQYIERRFIREEEYLFFYDPLRKQTEMDKERIIVQLYKNPPQEEHAILPINATIRANDGFIIMYSIANRRSFDEVPILIENVLRGKDVDSFPIFVVGNKIDLENERQVTKEEAEDFCIDKKIPFMELDCHNYEQVESVVIQLCKLMKNWDHIIETEERKKKKKWLRKLLVPKKECELPDEFTLPSIDIQQSSFQFDYDKIFQDKINTDVKFSFVDNSNNQGYSSFDAHQAILASRCFTFGKIFRGLKENKLEEVQQTCNSVNLKLIENKGEILTLSTEYFSIQSFYSMIRFLYSAIIDEEVKKSVKLSNDLLSISQTFKIDSLKNIMNKNISILDLQDKLKEKRENEKEILTQISDLENQISELLSNEIITMSNRFAMLLRKSPFSDFRIIIKEDEKARERRFFVHSPILSQRCEYFQLVLRNEMMEKKKEEILLSDISFDSFLLAIEYIYSDRFLPPNLTSAKQSGNTKQIIQANKIMLELLIICDYFQIPRLHQLCQKDLMENLHEDMFVFALNVSSQCNAQILEEFCTIQIGKNFQKFKKDPQFKNYLDQEQKDQIKKYQFPPENYIKYHKKFKVKLAKKFGLIEKEDERLKKN